MSKTKQACNRNNVDVVNKEIHKSSKCQCISNDVENKTSMQSKKRRCGERRVAQI